MSAAAAPLRVVAGGICCAVGYEAEAANCALRAGLDHFRESAFVSRGGDPVRVACLPETDTWVDEHCSGLWVTPPKGNDGFPDEFSDIRDQLQQIADKLDVGILDKVGLLKDALGEIADVAKAVVTPAVVDDILADVATKAAVKAGVGVLGSESVIIPVVMAVWTIHDIYSTAQNLAALAGEYGAAALKAFEKLYNIGDEVAKIVDQIVEEPAKALTNMMALLAEVDGCIRARKCMLVKYKNTVGGPTKARAQARHGRGCCPGQTGHHILPDKMVDGNCDNYDGDDAPVMCLEGTSNNSGWGSHGEAHQKLKKRMEHYREQRTQSGQSPNTISYDQAASEGIGAVRDASARQCDPKCLRAQLDDYYKNKCMNKTLPPADGTGPFVPKPEPTTLPTD